MLPLKVSQRMLHYSRLLILHVMLLMLGSVRFLGVVVCSWYTADDLQGLILELLIIMHRSTVVMLCELLQIDDSVSLLDRYCEDL